MAVRPRAGGTIGIIANRLLFSQDLVREKTEFVSRVRTSRDLLTFVVRHREDLGQHHPTRSQILERDADVIMRPDLRGDRQCARSTALGIDIHLNHGERGAVHGARALTCFQNSIGLSVARTMRRPPLSARVWCACRRSCPVNPVYGSCRGDACCGLIEHGGWPLLTDRLRDPQVFGRRRPPIEGHQHRAGIRHDVGRRYSDRGEVFRAAELH